MKKIFYVSLVIFALCITSSMSLASQEALYIPNFVLKSLNKSALDSSLLRQSDLGILYFFKKKCETCANGLNKINSIMGMPDNNIIAIGVGRGGPVTIKDYVERSSNVSLRFPVASVGRNTIKIFGINTYPSLIITGPDGIVLDVLQGQNAKISNILTSIGIRQFQRGKVEDARDIFKLALSEDKEDKKAKLALAYTYIASKDYKSAKFEFKKLENDDDMKIMSCAKAGLGQIYFKEKDYKKSYSYAKSSLETDPRNVMANTVLSLIFYAQGDSQKSYEMIKKAVSGHEMFAFEKSQSYLIKGNIQAKQGNKEQAIKSYNDALIINPFFVDAIVNKTNLLKDLSMLRKAISLSKKLSKIAPNDDMAFSLAKIINRNIKNKSHKKDKAYYEKINELAKRYEEDLIFSDGDEKKVLILGFEDKREDISGKIGFISILTEEIRYHLKKNKIKIVSDRILDDLLNALDVGAYILSDKSEQAKIASVLGANVVITGRITDKKTTLRAIEVEKLERVAIQRQEGATNLIKLSKNFIDKINLFYEKENANE